MLVRPSRLGGPKIEYATQASAGPIELAIFRGADGKFDLCEDEGDNYNYQQVSPCADSHALVRSRDKTLAITARESQYAGMPKQLELNIVWVTPGHSAAEAVEDKPGKIVAYRGKTTSVQAPYEASPSFIGPGWRRRNRFLRMPSQYVSRPPCPAQAIPT